MLWIFKFKFNLWSGFLVLSENQEDALSKDVEMFICFHFAEFNLQLGFFEFQLKSD